MMKNSLKDIHNDYRNFNFVTDSGEKDVLLIDYLEKINKNFEEINLKNISSKPTDDLYNFYKAKRIIIGSNSTFSWWGIFLNNDAKCYAPYLGNLERWLRNIPTTSQIFYDTKKYCHINHSEEFYSSFLSTNTLKARLIRKSLILLSKFLPFLNKYLLTITEIVSIHFINYQLIPNIKYNLKIISKKI